MCLHDIDLSGATVWAVLAIRVASKMLRQVRFSLFIMVGGNQTLSHLVVDILQNQTLQTWLDFKSSRATARFNSQGSPSCGPTPHGSNAQAATNSSNAYNAENFAPRRDVAGWRMTERWHLRLGSLLG